MKMKINGVNTFLDESTFVFIMAIWNYFLFLSFLRNKVNHMVFKIRNTMFPFSLT